MRASTLGGAPPVTIDGAARPVDESQLDHAERSSRVRLLLMAADLTAIIVGVIASTTAYQLIRPQNQFTLQQHLALGLLSLPVWPLALGSRKLYQARVISRTAEEFKRIGQAAGIVTGLIITGAFFLDVETLSRLWTLLVFVAVSTALLIERTVARMVFNSMRRKGMLTRKVVIVGTNLEALRLAQDLHCSETSGYRVVGFVGDDGKAPEVLGIPYLGSHELAADAVWASGANGVIVVTSGTGDLMTNKLTRELTELGIHVELTPALRDIAIHRFRLKELGGYPLLYVEPVIRDGWRSAAKRAFDIGFSLTVLLIASPVLAISAAIIKLDGGPVFFGQERVGLNGKRFKIWKLRTMVPNAEALLESLRDQNELDGPMFKMARDPRVTRIGRYLRMFSIDEIPQFWNVLRNDMSVVGPRPALQQEMDHWPPELHARLRAKPGITGVWQVSGRSSLTFESYERLDLFYVDNWSVWHDLVIVAKTLPAIIAARGAA
jgi:exopolysaccharide biosynthesis polyprenyl glycosylphosphotransferase